MKRIIGAVLLAIGTVLAIIGGLMSYGSVKFEFFGLVTTKSAGKILSSRYTFVYIGLIVIALAATLLAFLKKRMPAGILGVVAAVYMILTLYICDGQKLFEKKLEKTDLSIGKLDFSGLFKYSNGTGWTIMLISIFFFLAGAILCLIDAYFYCHRRDDMVN